MSTAPRTRAERAEEIRRRIVRATGLYHLEGMGDWRPAWDLIVPRFDAFSDALDAWEATGSPADQQAVRYTATALVQAWAEAADQWKRYEAGTHRQEVAHAA